MTHSILDEFAIIKITIKRKLDSKLGENVPVGSIGASEQEEPTGARQQNLAGTFREAP